MAHSRTTPLNKSKIEGHHCTADVRLEKLGSVPFFRQLDENELREVHKKFNATHFTDGETICREGEKAARLRVVVHGSVKLIRQTEEGKNILLDMLKPGEFFGNLTARKDEVYTETAIAQTNICTLAIGLHDFRTILNNFQSVAVSVLDIMTDRLTSSQEKIHQLSAYTVEKRIAEILLELSEKFGEPNEHGLLIQLPLSRQDLADMVGTSSETASRIMSRFQKEGVIKTGRRWVSVADKQQLEAVSD